MKRWLYDMFYNILKRKKEKGIIDSIIDNIQNESLYKDKNLRKVYNYDLTRAFLILSNTDHIQATEEELSRLREATKYAIERIVGFNISVKAESNYRGKLGISELIAKLYNLKNENEVQIDIVKFNVKIEKELSELSLAMYKEDAAILFGVILAGRNEIRGAKISISPVPLEKKEEYTLEETERTISSYLKSEKVEEVKEEKNKTP
jgi:hypothetical protein